MIQKVICATHSGRFHPDDVVAYAILRLVYQDNLQLIRTRDIRLLDKADIVFDVGNIYNPKLHKYDHHQNDPSLKRDNGSPYSSAGLVWKHFGRKIASEDIQQKIDLILIEPIDLGDNG